MSGHVVLIGLSGSGKSTVGRLLAERLCRPLYDTDAILAERAGQPVPELLRAGEPRFRALEQEAVAAACAAAAGIIATGGGAVLAAHNRALLREGNTVIWLRAPAATLVARLHGGEERPLLAGDPTARLAALAGERETLYAACAHDAIETAELTPETVVERILTLFSSV